jgi:hypothetical protein
MGRIGIPETEAPALPQHPAGAKRYNTRLVFNPLGR